MLSQENTPLLKAIEFWANSHYSPFHVPGHKRGQGISSELINRWGKTVFQYDLTELPGLDNLFIADGAIGQAQELAAIAFGAAKTYFLINGSSSGIIAAILAICQPGDKICLPRNVHKSVIHGLILAGAIPIFMSPEIDTNLGIAHPVTPTTVAHTLSTYPDIKAVFIVSPTYYGVCANLQAIATITHQYQIPLLVDEAHGAHFHFHPDLPLSALAAGADLTIQSTHKVLTSLTQSSMLHIQGNLINIDRLNSSLALVQSSSPNYLLLASLDVSRQQMALFGETLWGKTLELAQHARQEISKISHLSVLEKSDLNKNKDNLFDLDQTRLTIILSELGISGEMTDEIFYNELGIMAELSTQNSLTFIITTGNTADDIRQLINACKILASKGTNTANYPILKSPIPTFSSTPVPPFSSRGDQTPNISPRSAFFASNETVEIRESVGRFSAELICPYPPGIPVLMPGELITLEAIEYLLTVLKDGSNIVGASDRTLQTIKVLSD